MSRHYYDTLGQTTPIFYPVGYSFGARLQGRVHHAHLQVFVQRQPAGPLHHVPGRSCRFKPGDAQPDADDSARAAHARRRQDERRPLIVRRSAGRSRPWSLEHDRRHAAAGDDHGRPGGDRPGTGAGRLARRKPANRSSFSRRPASWPPPPSARASQPRSSRPIRPGLEPRSRTACRSSR